MPERNVPRALLLHPAWSSTAAVEAVRLWGELPEGTVGVYDLSAAAERALLSRTQLLDALELLERAGLVEEGPRGYARSSGPNQRT